MGALADRLRAVLPAARAGPALPPRSYAVLALVVDIPGGACLLLERRATGPNPWSGHLAFPGGRIEPGDPSPLAAALRETHEEAGIPPDRVEVAGHLMDLGTHLGHQVAAFAGVVRPGDVPAAPASPDEVAELLLVPLAQLRDLGAGAWTPQARGAVPVDAYRVVRHEARAVRPHAGAPQPPERILDYWHLEHASGRQAVLWGLTGRLVAELLARMEGWRRPDPVRVVEGWDELEP